MVFGDKAEIQNETSSNNLESIVNIEKLRGCISNIVYDESVLCKKQGLTQKKLKLMNNELEKIIQPMTEISYIDKIIHIIQIKLKQLRIR